MFQNWGDTSRIDRLGHFPRRSTRGFTVASSGFRINRRQLLRALEAQGFWRVYRRGPMGETRFSRKSRVVGCFEAIDCYISTDDYETRICTWNNVLILPGRTQWEGIIDGQVYGQRTLRTREQELAWREDILSQATRRGQELAESIGKEMLKRTVRARQAAKFYLSRLPEDCGDLEAFWNAQKERATPEQRAQAKRMLILRLVGMVADTAEDADKSYFAFQIAAYTIVLNSVVGTDQGFFSATSDPNEDMDLCWCFKIMASRIVKERGSEFILFD